MKKISVLLIIFQLCCISCSNKSVIVFYTNTKLNVNSELNADFNFYMKEIKMKYKNRFNYVKYDNTNIEEFQRNYSGKINFNENILVGFMIIDGRYYVKHEGIFSLIDFENTLSNFEQEKLLLNETQLPRE